MNKIELSIIFKNEKFACESHSITGDSLEEVLAKLPILIARILNKEHEEELSQFTNVDDDIPF